MLHHSESLLGLGLVLKGRLEFAHMSTEAFMTQGRTKGHRGPAHAGCRDQRR